MVATLVLFLVDEVGMVGRFEDVAVAIDAFDGELSLEFQVGQDVPLYAEVVDEVIIRRLVFGVQGGVVKRVAHSCL